MTDKSKKNEKLESNIECGVYKDYSEDKCRDPYAGQDCCFKCSLGYTKDTDCKWNDTGDGNCKSGPCIITDSSTSTCQAVATNEYNKGNKYKCDEEKCDNWKDAHPQDGWCKICPSNYNLTLDRTACDINFCEEEGVQGPTHPGGDCFCWNCDKDYEKDAGQSWDSDKACVSNPRCPEGQYDHDYHCYECTDKNYPYWTDASTPKGKCSDRETIKGDKIGCATGDCCREWVCRNSCKDYKCVSNPDERTGSCTMAEGDHYGEPSKDFYSGLCIVPWGCNPGIHAPEGTENTPFGECPDKTWDRDSGDQYDVYHYQDACYFDDPNNWFNTCQQGDPLWCDTCQGCNCGDNIELPSNEKLPPPQACDGATYSDRDCAKNIDMEDMGSNAKVAIQGASCTKPVLAEIPDRISANEKGDTELCCKILSAIDNTGKDEPFEKPAPDCNQTPDQDCIDCQSYDISSNGTCDTYMSTSYCNQNLDKVPKPKKGIAEDGKDWDTLDSSQFQDGWTGKEDIAFIENGNCQNWLGPVSDYNPSRKALVKDYCTQGKDGNYPAIMRPLCVDYCKENPKDCKDALTDFCGENGILKNVDKTKTITTLPYINGENSGHDLDSGAPDICGCYLPSGIYKSFIDDLEKNAYITSSATEPGEAKKDVKNFKNISCSFNACRSSLIHPDPDFPAGCPDTSICWQEFDINAHGSIIGDLELKGDCTGEECKEAKKAVCLDTKYYKCDKDKDDNLTCQVQPLGSQPTKYTESTCDGECAPSTATYLCKGDFKKKTCVEQPAGVGMDLDICTYDCSAQNKKDIQTFNMWIIIGSCVLALIIGIIIYFVVKKYKNKKIIK